MANTRVSVLDERRQPVPVGIPGELYIAGAGLAREYLGRPQLTAQKFVFHSNGERQFRTGDLVQWRPCGQLEFLRRLDNQVKLRGYRIELGEIEAALERIPGIQGAAVVIHQGTAGENRLVAYLVAATLEETALRQALSQELPDYMLPSQFVLLNQLPLSANGKLDRVALPDPGHVPPPDRESAAPHDALERRLLEIWASVLGRPSLSPVDSFFAVGGHSLQAARLVARIEETVGKRLPLPILFAYPSVRQIAAYLREDSDPASPYGFAAIQPRGSRPPVFLVEARSLFWEFAQLLGSDQPVFGMHWPDFSGFQAAIGVVEIARELIRVIQARQPRGPYVVGGWCIATLVAFEIAQQLTAQGERVELVLLFDGANPTNSQQRSSWQKMKTIARFYVSTTRFHWKHMRGMTLGKRLEYSLVRIATLQRHLRTTLWRYRYKLQLRAGKAVPPPEALPDIERVVLQAALDYRPKPYGGRVVYFKRGELPKSDYFEADFGWGRLLRNGLEIRETGGRHGEMFKPPHVQALAAAVRELLAEVRSHAPDDNAAGVPAVEQIQAAGS